MTPASPVVGHIAVPALLRRLAVANVVVNVSIVITGGLVRLTGSGLGCPTWPRCTPESVVPTEELAVHGAIEFGNRLLTFVLGLVALAYVVTAWRTAAGRAGRPSLLVPGLVLLLGGLGHVLLLVMSTEGDHVSWAWHLGPAVVDLLGLALLWRYWEATRRHGGPLVRPSPVTMGLAVLLGVTAQAVMGGITVRTGLNPWTVSAHFLLSALLISITLTAWNHLRYPAGERVTVAPRGLTALAWATAGVGAVTVVLGTVVTGSGPHSGDPEALRTGFDLERVSQLHVDAVFAFLGLAVGLWLASRDHEEVGRLHRSAGVLIVILLAQGAGGFTEYFTGLPIGLVVLHLLGATLTVLAITWVVHSTRDFVTPRVGARPDATLTVSAGG